MTNRMIIRAVTELLEDVPAEGRGVLDVSCKRGEILLELRRRGFTVRGSQYSPNAPEVDGIPIDRGVDLLKGLPYPAESFDVVLLVEVIEHLENHRAAIGELARVLKPGGILVLTTPNIMRLKSRLHFLLSGHHKTRRRFIPFDTPLSEAHRYHNHPIELPILCYLLRQNGLAIEQMGRGGVKAFSWVLYLLFAPITALYSWFFLWRREEDEQQRRENARLSSWLLNSRLLVQDNLILRIRKGPAGEIRTEGS
ncbi:MAG TPA: methyltransferase domain-containing protein [Planctomycetota bacterium]|jgi:SAM-dependent methyltransferase|nr:methyltransferase domain-containing protein [Planctomycetota bacterium]